MGLAAEIARAIERALQDFRFPGGQISGEVPASVLPPTGNTGTGYTPTAHTHDVADLEQSGAADGDVLTYDTGTGEWGPAAPTGGGGGAPVGATYIVQTADGTLTNEQALASLSTGLVKVTTGTGVLSTAVSNTDYAAATHATRHQSGGADAIKLDDLATPDDNTDLDATTGHHGLLPKLGGGTSNFLRADGSWAAPAGSFSNPMTTAGDIIYGGASGAPTRLAIGSTNRVLTVISGNPSWESPAAAPAELGYAAITSDLTTTSTSMVDATGLSVTVTVGSRPIIVEAYLSEARTDKNGARAICEIYDNTAAARVQLGIATGVTNAGVGQTLCMKVRLTPASGSRTYKVRWSVDAGVSATGTIRAASTNPSWIRVYEIAT